MKFSFFLGLIVDGSASPQVNNACAHGVNESRHALRRRRVGSLGICIMSVGGRFFYLIDFHIASPAPHRWTRLVRCVYILGSKSFGTSAAHHPAVSYSCSVVSTGDGVAWGGARRGAGPRRRPCGA